MVKREYETKVLKGFYEDQGYRVFFRELELSSLKELFSIKRESKTLFVSSSKLFRLLARIMGNTADSPDYSLQKAEQYMAFKEALKLLEFKGIPCLYFNRIGLKKDGYGYDKLAKLRIENKLSFPVMSDKPDLYKQHWEQILGERYSPDYLDEMKKIPQIIQKGYLYCHEDRTSEFINVIDGKRVTIGNKDNNRKTLHLYGRCGAFGYAVEDKETLASFLQDIFTKNGISINVINHGLWGGENDLIVHNFIHDSLNFDKNDIVVFYQKHLQNSIMKVLGGYGVYYYDITDKWHESEDSKSCFYDKPGHMNAEGYERTAKIMYPVIMEHINVKGKEGGEGISVEALNNYIRKSVNVDFEKELDEYIETIKIKIGKEREMVTGAIVMNCNPFTYGHRFLIEEALKLTERLIVFVVEEDRSFFKFRDRFEMVKKGVEDLKGVLVVPGGSFIISSMTFPEYFLKDYVREKNFDISSDINIFCKYIAPALNIKKRFAGEEPFDPVTENYNKSMKRILPEYGMEFIEIPRKMTRDRSEVINATRVRSLLAERKFDELHRYIPDSTYEMLMEKYV